MSDKPAITFLLRTQRGAVSGPHSVEVIRQKYVRGELHPEDQLQPSNDPRWFKVCRVRGLASATEAIGDFQTPQPAPSEAPTAKRTPAFVAPAASASDGRLSKLKRSIREWLRPPSISREEIGNLMALVFSVPGVGVSLWYMKAKESGDVPRGIPSAFVGIAATLVLFMVFCGVSVAFRSAILFLTKRK